MHMPCHAQVALHRDLRQGDTLAVRVGRRELCAAQPDCDCSPICAMEAALLFIRCAGKGEHGPTLILHATHASIASIGC